MPQKQNLNSPSSPLLKVENLHTYFFTPTGTTKAVDNVSFQVEKGKILGIVGESGCGKSLTALSIMRLVPHPGRIIKGHISFEGRNLLDLSQEEMRKLRGNKISMIFQDPMTYLNPVFTVGDQIMEVLQLHKHMQKSEARERTMALLKQVGIPDPLRRINEYPHQLSGGMRQRVMIAMSIACNPALIIADEPTTALDVTIQAQILRLLKGIVDKFHTAMILISHDLGIIAEIADHVAVMYAGQIVEYATTYELFYNPLHPYTEGLLDSIKSLEEGGKRRLKSIGGTVPELHALPEGCRFHPRCRYVIPHCTEEEPDLIDIDRGHLVRCWVRRKK